MRGPTPSVQGKGISATFDKLLELVGTGSSNVITASEIARAMEQDSFPISHDLKRLANCGTHGANTSNTERDFRRMVRGAYGFNLEPYTIKLTLDEPHLNSFIKMFFWATIHSFDHRLFSPASSQVIAFSGAWRNRSSADRCVCAAAPWGLWSGV